MPDASLVHVQSDSDGVKQPSHYQISETRRVAQVGALGAAQEALRRQLENQEKLQALQCSASQQQQLLTLQEEECLPMVCLRLCQVLRRHTVCKLVATFLNQSPTFRLYLRRPVSDREVLHFACQICSHTLIKGGAGTDRGRTFGRWVALTHLHMNIADMRTHRAMRWDSRVSWI